MNVSHGVDGISCGRNRDCRFLLFLRQKIDFGKAVNGRQRDFPAIFLIKRSASTRSVHSSDSSFLAYINS